MKKQFLQSWLIILAAIFSEALFLPVRAQSLEENQSRINISYTVEIVITTPPDVAGLLRQSSRLISKQGEGAVSASVLNRRIRSDIETFEEILRAEGYYTFSISQRTIPGRDSYQIILVVDPGQRFTIEALEIESPALEGPLAAKAMQNIGLKPDDPGRAEDIVIAGQIIVQNLATLGYPFAGSVGRDTVVDHETKTVSIKYFIDPGPFVLFGIIRFEGVVNVETSYLERFTTWQEGDVYSQSKVDSFRRRLIGTGLFRSVSVRPERPAAGGDQTTLLVSVTEGPHRTIAIGGGYSTSEGFGGEISWEHRNIFGRQERLRLQITGSEIEQSVGALFSKPHFKRLDQTLNLTAKFGREDTDAFDKVAFETSAAIERKLIPNLKGSAGVKLEILSIQENSAHEEFVILGAPIILAWDSSDNPLDPKKGFRILNTVKPSLSLLEENFPFMTIENRASTYFAMGKDKNVVLALRGRLGSTVGPTTLRLPASERFFSGGGGSVRGFGFQDIGPRDLNGDPIGGRSVVEVGFEVRTKISDTIGLVPFIEGGNVYTTKFPQFTNFRWGAGIGFRYYTSVAPIRFDIAFPINKRPGDATVQVYVSFGQSF